MSTEKPGSAVSSSEDQSVAMKRRRRQWLIVTVVAHLVVGAGYGAYWALVLRHQVSTDDAYVNGNVVEITPQISGIVTAIGADDTQFVNKGQRLVQIDQADAKVALDEAEAQLARTVREVRTLFATTSQLRATVRVRESELAMAEQDLARRERLSDSGAISSEELQHARDAVQRARAALLSTKEQLAANTARIDGTTIENHPEVRNAAAALRSAYLTYCRTELPAPVSGFVARRSVQLGQRVSPGAPLMAVVPPEQVWIDANFKEPQIADVRVGQKATLRADLYGRRVTYHGKVVGFGAGTGAAFALLPAQNATGNWIKIVQRVPVRIALDQRELRAHPLQIGLSMRVKVDTHDRDGPRLPEIPNTVPVYSTDVFGSLGGRADARVRTIIASNQGSLVSGLVGPNAAGGEGATEVARVPPAALPR